MKKVFRFQYEPCVETCYAHEDLLFSELRKHKKNIIKQTVDLVVKAHDSTCNDPNQRFGIDYDEKNKVFVGSFINNGRLDLFGDKSFLTVTEQLMNHVLMENREKTQNKGNCKYGNNGHENLAETILKQVG